MGTLDRHACRPRVHHRLPSRTPPFATRVQPSRLRLWTAILPELPRSPRAAGKPRAQHVESSVDRERLLAARGCEGSAQVADSDLSEVWARSLDGLADLQIQPHQRAWLKLTRPLGLVENTALIATPNEFVKEQLETRLRPLVTQALSQELGRDIQLAVTVDPSPQLSVTPPETVSDLESETAAPRRAGHPDTDHGPRHVPQAEDSEPPHPDQGPHGAVVHLGQGGPRLGGTRLNSKYTFETFVIGSSNRFAHAAAVAVAEAPAKAYNPLFVYGDSGLGKTHLLHAIGHYAQTLYSGLKVRYVSSEEFTNDFINMIRDGKQDGFRRRYRDVDVLLVDDIQFLENKEGTQEEFFHTFNTLHNASKQIVISSDRAPKRLVTLEDRLRSRFEWGLITDAQPPNWKRARPSWGRRHSKRGSTPPTMCSSTSRAGFPRTSANSKARSSG